MVPARVKTLQFVLTVLPSPARFTECKWLGNRDVTRPRANMAAPGTELVAAAETDAKAFRTPVVVTGVDGAKHTLQDTAQLPKGGILLQPCKIEDAAGCLGLALDKVHVGPVLPEG